MQGLCRARQVPCVHRCCACAPGGSHDRICSDRRRVAAALQSFCFCFSRPPQIVHPERQAASSSNVSSFNRCTLPEGPRGRSAPKRNTLGTNRKFNRPTASMTPLIPLAHPGCLLAKTLHLVKTSGAPPNSPVHANLYRVLMRSAIHRASILSAAHGERFGRRPDSADSYQEMR